MRTSSMGLISSQGGHSAQVTMNLLINGHCLPVTQMGPDYILLGEPVNQPPAMASLIMQVDQSERRWNVRLPHGITVGKKRVAIAPWE